MKCSARRDKRNFIERLASETEEATEKRGFGTNDWSKGTIFKLPKKGDLGNCDNEWGITLLSVLL